MATHLNQSNYLANQQQVSGFAVPSPASESCPKLLGQNHFAELLLLFLIQMSFAGPDIKQYTSPRSVFLLYMCTLNH